MSNKVQVSEKWCCAIDFENGRTWYDETTLSWKKSVAIKNFTNATSYSSAQGWRRLKKDGWRCEKVKVTIEPR